MLSSEQSCEESHASKIEYDGACISMRLLNFLIVLRVMEELMVVMSGLLMNFLTALRAVSICFVSL